MKAGTLRCGQNCEKIKKELKIANTATNSRSKHKIRFADYLLIDNINKLKFVLRNTLKNHQYRTLDRLVKFHSMLIAL